MQPRLAFLLTDLFLLGATVVPLQQSAAKAGATSPANHEAHLVECRVLEAHQTSERGVTIVIFHQEAREEHQRLADLLKRYSGGNVEWQRSDGQWAPATVIRLKSCFGRGLLVIPAAAGAPEDGEGFVLKFPETDAAAVK
jgi:hypothetical protein